MSDLDSRPRPGKQPNDVAALRALRTATRDYMVVLEAGYQALTNGAIERKPELAYLRSCLGLAIGKRGTGAGFGTPVQLEGMLTRMLGESTETT
jgi:hypothetical protein